MRDALPGLDVVDLGEHGLKQLLDDARELKVSAVSATASGRAGAVRRPTPWKCPMPNRVTAATAVMLGSLLGAKGKEACNGTQTAEEEAAEGNLLWWFVMLCLCVHLLCDAVNIGKDLNALVWGRSDIWIRSACLCRRPRD